MKQKGTLSSSLAKKRSIVSAMQLRRGRGLGWTQFKIGKSTARGSGVIQKGGERKPRGNGGRMKEATNLTRFYLARGHGSHGHPPGGKIVHQKTKQRSFGKGIQSKVGEEVDSQSE